MLKRRRTTHKFKRNVIYSTATRRRIMLRNTHKKVIWRRRLFAMQLMEAQVPGNAGCITRRCEQPALPPFSLLYDA